MSLSRQDRSDLSAAFDQIADDVEVFSSDWHVRKKDESWQPTRIRDLRRRRGSATDDLASMTLIEENGVLRWVEGFGFRQPHGRGRRRRGMTRSGKVVKQLKFERLERSSVGGSLQRLDKRLTPHNGLREWKSLETAIPAPVLRSTNKKRVLLFVHGTFSNTENVLGGVQKAKSSADKVGEQFFARALKTYDHVLSFDHPTLAVGPILNAVRLDRALRGANVEVDIIAHSRGGLVSRWWAEELNNRPERVGKVILVGSPLAGTSLASPPRLRSALDFLTNVARAVEVGAGAAATALPMLAAVTGLMRIFSSITNVAAKTPIADVIVATIPGIAAQSRTADNQDLALLRKGAVERPNYFAVTSNFEPTSTGWEFWRFFTDKPLLRLADAGADLVFKGANDLVVDTVSMRKLARNIAIPDGNRLDYPKNDKVHHTNYFEQPETIAFFEKTLKLG